MGGIRDVVQPWHLLIILVIVLVIFGPRKLPEIGSALGKSIRDFKSSLTGNHEEKTPIETPSDPNNK